MGNKRGHGIAIIMIIILLVGPALEFVEFYFESNPEKLVSFKELFSKETYCVEEVVNGQDFKLPTGNCPCGLKITTKAGANFYIYMEDQDGDNDYSFYVEGGQPVIKHVPVGRYKIYYCMGNEWYGLENKFGKMAMAQKSDTILEFTCAYKNGIPYYGGHELKLYPVANGNLPTEMISMKNMPT